MPKNLKKYSHYCFAILSASFDKRCSHSCNRYQQWINKVCSCHVFLESDENVFELGSIAIYVLFHARRAVKIFEGNSLDYRKLADRPGSITKLLLNTEWTRYNKIILRVIVCNDGIHEYEKRQIDGVCYMTVPETPRRVLMMFLTSFAEFGKKNNTVSRVWRSSK